MAEPLDGRQQYLADLARIAKSIMELAEAHASDPEARLVWLVGFAADQVIEKEMLGSSLEETEADLRSARNDLFIACRERDEARAQLQTIGRKAFWAAKEQQATNR